MGLKPGALKAPVLLTDAHDLAAFDSGVAVLDEWLRKQALKNQVAGASRAFVLCSGDVAIGYYSLAAGAIDRAAAPGAVRRDMPDPIPVIVLGRLAIGRRDQGQGLGTALLRDAVLRVLPAAEVVGVRAILVHAISPEAKAFYLSRGFLASPVGPMTLCLVLETARRTLTEE